MSVAQNNLTGSISYEDLYRRWENSSWSAMEIDLSADVDGWAALSDLQRRSALWIYSMFFYGEDSVTDNLSPFIDAAPREEQKYFLATQQADEARHAVFFHRFFKEVIGVGDDIASTLATTTPQLNWGYMKVFDRLDRMADELRADRSLPKFAQAITLYHLVVEGTLAQPGQHYIEDFFMRDGSLPGFSAGMENISRDEQRHIGFGVKVLSELLADAEQGDECKAAVDEILGEVMQYTSSIFIPPGWDREYTRCYGFELEDIAEFGMRSIEAKWKAIGYPMSEMAPGVIPMDFSIPARERGARLLKLVHAGVVGEPGLPADSSPDSQELYFDLISRSVDPTAANGSPFTIQWQFSDAAPWHLVVDNGSTRAVSGNAPSADVTMKSSWQDFIELGKGAISAPRAISRRKLKLSGGIRSLITLRKLLPDP